VRPSTPKPNSVREGPAPSFSPSLSLDLTGRTDFLCIDGSGCTAPFSETQIRGFLDTKTLAGWEQLITENEIKAVSLSRVLCSCSFLPSNYPPKPKRFPLCRLTVGGYRGTCVLPILWVLCNYGGSDGSNF
jgi:hypothetical protein